MKKGDLCIIFYEVSENDLLGLESARFHGNTGMSFQAEDIITATQCKKLIEILSIFVDKDCRRQGFGSEMLKTICSGADQDTIIIAGAGALKREFPNEPTKEEYDKLFAELDSFYKANNFEDVTEIFGTYDGETKRTYMYKNDAGLKAIEKMTTK